MKVGSDCVSIDVDEFANIPNITEGPLIFSGLEVGFPVITDSSEMIIGDESDGTNLNNNVVNLVATDNPPELINFDENDYVDDDQMIVDEIMNHYEQSLLPIPVIPLSYEEKVEKIKNNPTFMERIDFMLNLALNIFPTEDVSVDFIVDQIYWAFLEKDRDKGIEDCIAFGGDYEIPTDEVDRNSLLFQQCNHDFPEFIRRVQAVRLKDRFNENRVRACMSPSDPDYELILEMSKGIRIITGDDWEPNLDLGNPKLRKVYVDAHHGINKVIGKQSKENTIVILPMSDRIYLPKRSTIHTLSHALKPNKPEGRVVNDYSNLGLGEGQPLNNKNVKEKVIAKYGAIVYPTLLDIIRMIIRIVLKYGWEFIILWKDDLVGAYTLLNIHPESVSLLCAELMNESGSNLLSFNTAMAFGGIQFAYVMNVPTRVLQFKYDAKCTDGVVIYSDDTIGCCHIDNLANDVAEARKAQTDLLGPYCINTDPLTTKYEANRILTVIGWRINLDTKLVSMSVRNANKCLYAFFMVDIYAKVKTKELQKLASLASRYCQICSFMIFATQDLHRLAAQSDRIKYPIDFSGGAKFAISLWRVILILMNFNPSTYTCYLDSFIFKLPQYVIGHDGSLYGIGFIIWEISPNGEKHMFKFCGADITFYGFGINSSYQNTAEFISMTMGLATLVRFGITDKPVYIISDSTSSLSWAETGNHKSGTCQRATALFATLGFISKNYITGGEHLAGTLNTNCDALSRIYKGYELPDICKAEPEKRIYIERDVFLNKLLGWCNPKNASLFNGDGTMKDMDIFISINSEIKSYCNK